MKTRRNKKNEQEGLLKVINHISQGKNKLKFLLIPEAFKIIVKGNTRFNSKILSWDSKTNARKRKP